MTRDQSAVKVDWDGDAWMDIGEMTRRVMRAGYRLVAVATAPSPSGKGHHCIVHVSPRPSCPFEVVALALILGSDVNREMMQMVRAVAFRAVPQHMKDAWNVLYEPHPQRIRHLKLRDYVK